MVIRSSKKYKKCAIKEDYLPLLNTDDCLPPRCLRLSAIERFANAAVRSWATSELFAHKETRKRTYKHHALSYTCTSSSSTVTRNDNRANKARCSCRTECMGCTLETCFRRQIYVSLSCCTHYYLKTKVHTNRTFNRTAEARLTSAESHRRCGRTHVPLYDNLTSIIQQNIRLRIWTKKNGSRTVSNVH